MIEKFPFLSKKRIDITEEVVEGAKGAYKAVLESCDGRIFSHDGERELNIYWGLRALFSARGSWRALGEFYAKRVLVHLRPDEIHDFFALAGVEVGERGARLEEYMKVPHFFPETKIYHLPVKNGFVYLSENAKRYFAADVAYFLSTKGLPDNVPEWVRKHVAVRKGKERSPFFEALLQTSGLPDGRKRIIYYWIVPYLVTVKGVGTEEALERVKEWVGRQGGEKILDSWIKSEIENVRKKGIRPWSIGKVRKVDPDVIRILEDAGVLG